jgi:hypothetical protein
MTELAITEIQGFRAGCLWWNGRNWGKKGAALRMAIRSSCGAFSQTEGITAKKTDVCCLVWVLTLGPNLYWIALPSAVIC